MGTKIGAKPSAMKRALMASETLPRWDICIAKAKAQWLGIVEAETAEEAIARAAKGFGREASKLIAVRHP